MQQAMRVCVVGLGRAGNFHLTAIKDIDGLQLQSVVDANPQVLQSTAEKWHCTGYSTIDEALQDNSLDIVIVASPTDSHYEYVTKSLQAGKHVFSEKPLGHTLEEIEQCFDLAAANNKALYLGFQRRYDASFMALKARLPQLGDVRIIKASSRDNPEPSMDYLRISGNIFHDMLIHDLDMLTFLLGTDIPETIYASGAAYNPEIADMDDLDTVLLTVKYPNGIVCSIDTSRISAYGYDQRIEVFGEKGMARVENKLNDNLQLATADGHLQSPANYSFPQRYKEAYFQELVAFADGLATGVHYNVTKRECVLAHLMADAAHESSKTGQAVRFDEQFGAQVPE